jgi:hypothetical protein
MSAEQVGAILAHVTPAYFIHRARLAELALRHRLPSVFASKSSARTPAAS